MNELINQTSFILIFDSREELCAKFSDCLWFVERQSLVHLTTTKVTGHALRLENWFELTIKIDVWP